MKECPFCHYKYSSSNISRHIKYSCKFNPDKVVRQRLTCQNCGTNFCNDFSLKQHLRNHCRNKPKLIMSNKKLIKKDPVVSKKTIINSVITRKPLLLMKPRNKTASEILHVTSEDEEDEEAELNTSTGNCILDRIIAKMGKEIGLDYLIGNFLTKNYSNIIEKAYLENIGSDEYPFACKGRNHFRYYDKNSDLIDDVDGTLLSKTIHKGIQNAALTSSIIIIKKHLDNDNNEELYDNYDLAQLQGLAYKMTIDRSVTKIKKYLATRVLNPNHPYFKKHSSAKLESGNHNGLIY